MRPVTANDSRRAAHLPAWICVVLCALAATAAQARESDSAKNSSPAVEKKIDFAADVEPILAAHCRKCHGAQMRSGGLRLDAREHALRGGDSGRPVLGGPIEQSELWARVSSSDRNDRMPKNAPRLADEQIEILRQWVGQGTPWPAPPISPKAGRPFYERWLTTTAAWADRYEAEYDYAFPYIVAFLAAQFVLLFVIRCRTAYRQGRPWTAGRLRAFCRLCDGVNSRELLLVILLLFAGLALAVARGHILAIDRTLAKTERATAKEESPWTHTVYGWPPKPVRGDHPKQVAGTYYRGNCERNRELFNGGNYLTAIFRVSLCDRERRQLDVGSKPPPSGILVRVEIERAPGTTDALFSKELMASVLLVRNFYEAPDDRLKETPARLEILEPDQRWAAYVPLGEPEAGAPLAGQIYIYTGQVADGRLQGTLQYGVAYDLRFAADGTLSPESDLWMDSFGNSAFEEPRPFNKLPYREWFDHRPMPVISGENSQDPKLLGVEEYVKKGLIKPEGSKPNGEKPEEAKKPNGK